jgi:hypothetical protein
LFDDDGGAEEVDVLDQAMGFLFCEFEEAVVDYAGAEGEACQTDGSLAEVSFQEAVGEDLLLVVGYGVERYQATCYCSIEGCRPGIVDEIAQFGEHHGPLDGTHEGDENGLTEDLLERLSKDLG